MSKDSDTKVRLEDGAGKGVPVSSSSVSSVSLFESNGAVWSSSEESVLSRMGAWLEQCALSDEYGCSCEDLLFSDSSDSERASLSCYSAVLDPLGQLAVHPCPEVRDLESENGKMQYVGMKQCLFQMWLLLGRKSEITCNLLHMTGVYRARRVNEYVWIVRKLRFVPASPSDTGSEEYPLYIRKADRKKDERPLFKVIYSPYYMFVPDDMLLEQEEGIESWQIMLPVPPSSSLSSPSSSSSSSLSLSELNEE